MIIGSILHGTLRTEDLLEAFADCLKTLDTEGEYRDLLAEAHDIDPDSELASGIVNDLHDALGEYCPPFFYFGLRPGEGTDFGFWFDSDALNEAVETGEVFKCDELPEYWPQDYEYVAVVTDHGNVTLYSPQVSFREEWSIV